MLSFSTSSTHRSRFTARRVKYIAKRAEKNISSLESQIMVPTETILGRSDADGILTAEDVVVTI
jgi:hypothetical protein